MDIVLYHRYLEEYVQQACDSSDGTPGGIAEGLRSIKPPGRFTRNREERQAALREAIKAFEEHRHWPLNIIISHLGVDIDR